MNKFIKFTSACCFITAITTLGIHIGFPSFSLDFNERLLLYKNPIYLLNRWWVIGHCLLVIISMWGFYLVRKSKSQGFAGLGFLFFCLFSVTEIFRQISVLFYLNGLRIKYLATENDTIKEILKVDIENFNLIGTSLFGLFILSFALGNLFYGFCLWNEKGFSKILSFLFIIWSIGNFLALHIEFYPNQNLDKILQHYNYTYQPFMRITIGWWLWQNSKETESIVRNKFEYV